MTSEPDLEPYTDDADYWQHVAAHVLAALRRHDAGEPDPGEVQRVALVEHLKKEEARLREEVKSRVEATRNSARTLAIDTVRHRYDLDAVEVATVKLAVVFAVEKQACADAGRVFGPSVDELLRIIGLGVADRVRRLRTFTAAGRLRRHGLIHLEAGGEAGLPAESLGAWVYITELALEVLVGLRPVSDLPAPE